MVEMDKKKDKEEVEIKTLMKKQIKVKIKGVTPLLIEKMDMGVVETYNKKKAQKMTKKDTRLEEEKSEAKLHYTEEGHIGFPASGFYKGMIEVAPYLDGLDKKLVRGSVRVLGNILPIEFSDKLMNTAWGRQSGKIKAPCKIVRPELKNWSCVIEIIYNASNISAEQIVNLVNWAGFQMGLGSWRPEKGGSYGQYEVMP